VLFFARVSDHNKAEWLWQFLLLFSSPIIFFLSWLGVKAEVRRGLLHAISLLSAQLSATCLPRCHLPTKTSVKLNLDVVCLSLSN